MTIEQTVEVPANHRLTLEVPPEIPAGKVQVLFRFPVENRDAGISLNAEIERRLGRPPTSEEECSEWAEWLETMAAIRQAHGTWAANPWVNALEEIRAERDANESVDPWKNAPAVPDRGTHG
jgi:hypothetical protein